MSQNPFSANDPEEFLSSFHAPLIYFSHYIRDAWRLKIETKNPPARRMLGVFDPNEDSALRDLKRIGALDERHDGDFRAWFEQRVAIFDQTMGPISKWIQGYHISDLPMDWRALSRVFLDGFDAAKSSVTSPSLVNEFDWERCGQACVALQFVSKAVASLHELIEKGSLESGTRAHKLIVPDKALVRVRVVASDGRTLADADWLDAALKEATCVTAISRPSYELTLDEFINITTVIDVDRGRGKTGQAKTGQERLLFRVAEDHARLKLFFSRAYDLAIVRGQEGLAPKEDWVSTSVKTIMAESFDTPLKFIRLPGAGHLLLNAGATDAQVRHVLKIEHRDSVLEGMNGGFSVPDRACLSAGLPCADDPPEVVLSGWDGGGPTADGAKVVRVHAHKAKG